MDTLCTQDTNQRIKCQTVLSHACRNNYSYVVNTIVFCPSQYALSTKTVYVMLVKQNEADELIMRTHRSTRMKTGEKKRQEF